MAWTIIIGISLIGFAWLYTYSKKRYKYEMLSVSKKEYPFWRYLPLGLFVLDRLGGFFSEKPNYDLLQLYGKRAYAVRYRLFEGERITLALLLFFGTLLVVMCLNIKSLTVKDVSEIEKSEFGEGDSYYHYFYELEVEDKKNKEHAITYEPFTIVVPEKSPTKLQIKDELDKIIHELPELILQNNLSLQHVNQPLFLPIMLSEKVAIRWESSNDKLLLNNGEIRYNNLNKEGETVTLKATIDCYGEKKLVQYTINLYKKSLSTEIKKQQLAERIKELLSKQALSNVKNNKVILPQSFSDYDAVAKWYDGEKKVGSLSIILIGLCISYIFFLLKRYELKTSVKKREEELLRAFPGCINKFALLMNAGLTFGRAWEKITKDYLRIKERSGESILLYEEMLMTLEDLKKGVSELKAYESFGHRCKIPEILRFTAIIMQNIKKGSHLLIGAMQQQSKEAMSMREDLARKKGEKASTKLVLPMGIMFMAILIIVITPAIITLKF
ncbi:MAG: hypothetical protein CVV02_06560 [Firmicutes bacterium HGW-Firmicutes-7]|nr:MAG: hypothetical protein CVV02_06560 [Firmicutes bacterium HGW-Firmicutes-7]